VKHRFAAARHFDRAAAPQRHIMPLTYFDFFFFFFLLFLKPTLPALGS